MCLWDGIYAVNDQKFFLRKISISKFFCRFRHKLYLTARIQVCINVYTLILEKDF